MKVHRPIYFVGRDQRLHQTQKGRFSGVIRIITKVLRIRNYNALPVLKAAAKTSEIKLPDNKVAEYERQVAREMGISAKTYAKLHAPHDEVIKTLENKLLRQRAERLAKALPENSSERGRLYYFLERRYVEEKWKSLDPGLPSWVLDHHYPDVKWLVKSHVLLQILCCQNTTKNGKLQHAIKVTDEGLMIKKEGAYVLVKELRDTLNWDYKKDAVVATDGSKQEWNYFSPNGLVPISRFYHEGDKDSNDHLTPIEKLSDEEMNTLRSFAQKTYTTDEEKAANSHKRCVIQIVTHPKAKFKDSFLTRNLNNHGTFHVAIRIVMENGEVYSTGALDPAEERKVRDGYFNRLATTNAQMMNMDCEEYRRHTGRLVTSIPIDEEQAKSVLEQCNQWRKNGFRFNILSQNCAYMGAESLRIGKIANLDLRMTAKELMIKILPDATDIPGVNKVALPLANRRKSRKEQFKSLFPKITKQFVPFARKVILLAPSALSNMCINLLLIIAARADLGTPKGPHIEENEHVRAFDQIVGNVHALFSEHSTTVHHSVGVIRWQLQQLTTAYYDYSGQPDLNILPPNDVDTDKLGKVRKSFIKS